ncbi:hypothetical protein JXA56_01070 [Candidatus Micrarchaeota archaeon]|nr:hypothetical protein [Candidatus Micrarchaeota archaeon]
MGQAQKEKPSEPVVPQLAPQEVRRRSEPIFDAAASSFFVPKAANLNSEIADYLKILEAKLKGKPATQETAESAYKSANAEYVKKYPKSTLSYLLREEGFDFQPQFDFSEQNGKIASVKFSASDVNAFKKDASSTAAKLEKAFGDFKKLVLDNMVKASKPVETGKYDHFFVQQPSFLTADEFKKLCSVLGQKIKSNTPTVPVNAEYVAEFSPPKLKLEYGGPRKIGEINAG